MGVAVNDIVLLSLRGTQAGQRIIMTRTYRCTVASSPDNSYADDMGELIAAVSAGALGGIRGRYLSLLPTAYNLAEIRAQVISPTRRVMYSVQQIGQNGSNEGVGNVTNLAAVMTFRTALSGRSQVSNVHLGPIPSDVSSAGQIDATYRLAMNEMKNLLLADIVPTGFDVATWRPCIFHRTATGTMPKWDDITSGLLQATTRVMRRRTVGVGE